MPVAIFFRPFGAFRIANVLMKPRGALDRPLAVFSTRKSIAFIPLAGHRFLSHGHVPAQDEKSRRDSLPESARQGGFSLSAPLGRGGRLLSHGRQPVDQEHKERSRAPAGGARFNYRKQRQTNPIKPVRRTRERMDETECSATWRVAQAVHTQSASSGYKKGLEKAT
jgi:hypothetical protein